MSNQLQQKAAALAQILSANKLTKDAAQTITHKSLMDQTNLGREQTEDLHSYVDGIGADTAAASNNSSDKVQEVVGAQSLNRSSDQAMSASGTSVNVMEVDGSGRAFPETKNASARYRARLNNIVGNIRKKASANQVVTTASEALAKVAALNGRSSAAQVADAENTLRALVATNPLFGMYKQAAIMRKVAEDVKELSEAEGIPPEQAADELATVADAAPEMSADLETEASQEAVEDLAADEQDAAELMDGMQLLADNASASTGEAVTVDDIEASIDAVVEQAEADGVEPEAIIAAAVEQMQGGAEGGAEGDSDLTEEDMAMAQELIQAAASEGVEPEELLEAIMSEDAGGENSDLTEEDMAMAQEVIAIAESEGVSPEEVVEALSGEMSDDAGVTEEDIAEATDILEQAAAEGIAPEEVLQAVMESDGGEEAGGEKVASLQKRAGTLRSAFVQDLRRRRL